MIKMTNKKIFDALYDLGIVAIDSEIDDFIKKTIPEETFEGIAQKHVEFCRKTYPLANAINSLTKLNDEIKEVVSSIVFNCPGLASEYADCMLCLLSSASFAGIYAGEILEAMAAKVDLNMSSNWQHNGNGTYSRVKV